MQEFDQLIIGGGLGGGTAALTLAARGQQVGIVEERDWGGVTINRGSTPKRALLAGAAAHFRLRQLQASVSPVDWPSLATHSARVVLAANQHFGDNLMRSGVTTIEGHAEFVDAHTIQVHGQTYRARQFILATGARPRMLQFPGSQYLQHSASFLKAAKLPAKITFIGAGIIAFALASIASEAGAQVTIIQHNQRALGIFDHGLVQQLITRLKQAGVRFEFDTTVQKLEVLDQQTYQLTTKSWHD